MPLDVVPLGSTRAERLRFLRAGTAHYRGAPHHVPPLTTDLLRRTDPAANPFFRHAEADHLLAVRDGRDVGRVAAIRNTLAEEFRKDRTGYFGWFECEDDDEAARALLDEAARRLRARGCDALLGPVSYSTNDECGLLVEGFDGPPFLMMPWNPPRYEAHLLAAGLAPAEDLLAWHLDIADVPIFDRLERVTARARERYGWSLRPVAMARFDEELETIRALYNRAWEANWGFVPMTTEEFRHSAADLKAIVRPEFVLLAERKGEPLGFSLTLPDFNQVLRRLGGSLLPFGWLKALWYSRRITELRTLALGVVPEARGQGIEAALYLQTIRTAARLGYTGGECSWMLQRNTAMNRIMESLGALPYRRYRLFSRRLTG